jgi:hypothetical protein
MKTIIIIEGVTLTATRSTIDRYFAEKREAEVLAELTAWLADPANQYSEEYSDIYKDVYGFRPRW